jgi:TPR repeat protein
MAKNGKALNALGYIYLVAPTFLDKDEVKLKEFGSIRRDLTKAYKYFKKGADLGNPNA